MISDIFNQDMTFYAKKWLWFLFTKSIYHFKSYAVKIKL